MWLCKSHARIKSNKERIEACCTCTRETVKPTELMEQEQFELDFGLMGSYLKNRISMPWAVNRSGRHLGTKNLNQGHDRNRD